VLVEGDFAAGTAHSVRGACSAQSSPGSRSEVAHYSFVEFIGLGLPGVGVGQAGVLQCDVGAQLVYQRLLTALGLPAKRGVQVAGIIDSQDIDLEVPRAWPVCERLDVGGQCLRGIMLANAVATSGSDES
jgi:hypothetical protein